VRGFELRHDIKENDVIGSILVIDMFNDFFENEEENQLEIYDKINKNVEDLDLLNEELETIDKEIERLSRKSFRNFFIRYPESKCPDENYDIPDVQKRLEEIFKDREPVSYPGIGA
jgi:hypothetical protein